MRYWLVLAALFVTPAAAQTPPRAKIILVGDSTVQAKSGWGGSFCADHVAPPTACVNLARGGRSSKSFRVEGLWDAAITEMKVPGFARTYVLIGFGHNDSSTRPERHTDVVTEFPANMTRYVAEIRATGAIPVLFTPLTQRMFRDGKLIRDLDPWAAAVRTVGAETKTPVVDMMRLSADAVQAMGPVAANRFAPVPPPAEVQAAAATGTTIPAPKPAAPPPPGTPAPPAFDYTHLGPEGAVYFSKMMTAGLAAAVPGMRPLLVP